MLGINLQMLMKQYNLVYQTTIIMLAYIHNILGSLINQSELFYTIKESKFCCYIWVQKQETNCYEKTKEIEQLEMHKSRLKYSKNPSLFRCLGVLSKMTIRQPSQCHITPGREEE
ncbi:unnamed protein product [Paramecium sonneborni]|uniref:Uncharacterized protein n=1 Tax=Paramecium sonneborni TaxID=65129 RepID=A0A8S1RQ10_9CILI|nr:unnamed protein product [Paramecium sonneborni]